MVTVRMMARRVGALGGALALGACAVAPPTGPTVMALPQKGQSFSQFQQDDLTCRQFASARTGGTTPSQAATNAGIGSAVLGTALGAAAGAAIGSVGGAVGAGAAIGGATGLLAGSAIGTGNAAASAAALQQAYNISYTQCMVAHGNEVRASPGPSPLYTYPTGFAGFVVAPTFSYGWGWGWGWPGGWWGWPGWWGWRGGWGWRPGWGWNGGWGWRGGRWGGAHWAWHH